MNVRWEAFVKGAAAAALGAYVVGLIAVALYLEKLDVPLPDLAAVKPRFAYTGALVLASLAVIALPVAVAVVDWRDEHRSAPTRWGAAGLVALAAALYLGLVYVLHRDQPAFFTNSNAEIAARLVFCAIAVGVLAAAIYMAIHTDKDRSFLVASSVLALLVFAVLFVYGFSTAVLPRVPSQFGGIQPARARLLFTSDAVADAKAIGVAFPRHTTLSKPVSVLYEGDQYYVLRLGTRIVQIAQDNVVGSITDSTQPVPKRVYTLDHGGHADVPDPRDQIVLAFSEPLDPASVFAGWDGRTLAASLRADPTHEQHVERLTVRGPLNALMHVGHILMHVNADIRVPQGQQLIGVTMRMSGSQISLTLGRPLRRAFLTGRIESWKASPKATDMSGNSVVSRARNAADEDSMGPGSGARF